MTFSGVVINDTNGPGGQKVNISLSPPGSGGTMMFFIVGKHDTFKRGEFVEIKVKNKK